MQYVSNSTGQLLFADEWVKAQSNRERVDDEANSGTRYKKGTQSQQRTIRVLLRAFSHYFCIT
jgi:hypothetical protein